MATRLLATIFVLVAAFGISAKEAGAENEGIELSPELLSLLRAEMNQIAVGVQSLALSLASGNWKAIQETSNKIRASYIMERELTPEQAEELAHKLPDQFKKLDAEFHQRADKLAKAATTHDGELVAFHYSRLLESCSRCHADYASHRFPGFASPAPAEHHH